MSIPTAKGQAMGAALQETEIVRTHAAAGAIAYDGFCYDRHLNRCRVYAVADGQGGLEWRIARTPAGDEGGEAGVERCFRNYQEAMRWIG
jgi:hypothetical protein